MFWVYILRCADGSYYTGHTDDIERRMGQYQSGECDGYVAAHSPVKLAWSQECTTREEALTAEMQIKGWSRKKKEAMMRGDWSEVSRLAQNKTTVRGEPFDSAQDRLIEPHTAVDKSIHPSTGSGRMDLLLPNESVRL